MEWLSVLQHWQWGNIDLLQGCYANEESDGGKEEEEVSETVGHHKSQEESEKRYALAHSRLVCSIRYNFVKQVLFRLRRGESYGREAEQTLPLLL